MNKILNHFGRVSGIVLSVALISAADAQIANAPATGSLSITNFGPYNGWGPWGWNSTGAGGAFMGSYTAYAGSGTTSSPGQFLMYCTSTTNEFSMPGTFDVSVQVEDTDVGWLVDNITPTSSDEDVALQLAIWSDLGTNNITGSPSSTVLALEAGYLAAGAGNVGWAYYLDLPYSTSPGQPQVAPDPLGPPGPGNPNIQPGAPGPAAVIPFGLGLVGKLRRRRKAQKA